MRLVFATAFVFVLCGVGFAQGTTEPSLTPGTLSPAEHARLLTRVVGTWRLNREKSIILNGDTLGVPNGYIYQPSADGKSVTFISNNGTSVQYYDGKAYGRDGGNTIARAPLNEFTIDNVLGRNGRRSGRNTQMYSEDGTKAAYIVRRVDEQGVERVISVVLFEKVPDGTDVFSDR